MDADHLPYFHYTSRARVEKAVNTLLGLVDGIAIDKVLNPAELAFFEEWVEDQTEYHQKHPFNELVPVVRSAIEDGVVTMAEKEDIQWLGSKLLRARYFKEETTDVQHLHAILGGIASDGIVSKKEIKGLKSWLAEHEHLTSTWPYDELWALTVGMPHDPVEYANYEKVVLTYFSQFVDMLRTGGQGEAGLKFDSQIAGLCAVGPEITFKDSRFCFTGGSPKKPRKELAAIVERLGGSIVNSVSKKLNYLVICSEANPCWAYACYGRKVETAMNLRKQGIKITLVREHDFHDEVANFE